MEPTTFQVRRVLVGVVVGLGVLMLLFYGWIQYRTAQYHHRAGALVQRYRAAYVQCVDAGGPALSCAARVTGACRRDAFWSGGSPFDALPGTSPTDVAKRCAAVAS